MKGRHQQSNRNLRALAMSPTDHGERARKTTRSLSLLMSLQEVIEKRGRQGRPLSHPDRTFRALDAAYANRTTRSSRCHQLRAILRSTPRMFARSSPRARRYAIEPFVAPADGDRDLASRLRACSPPSGRASSPRGACQADPPARARSSRDGANAAAQGVAARPSASPGLARDLGRSRPSLHYLRLNVRVQVELVGVRP